MSELFVGAALGLAVSVLTMAVEGWRRTKRRRSRLAALRLSPIRPTSGRGSPRLLLRSLVAALGRLLGGRSGASNDRLARLIDASGLAGRITPAEIFGCQLTLLGMGLVSTLVLCLA